MFLQEMSCDAGTVIYRSTMHAGLKRNVQAMPGAEWLALLCIPGFAFSSLLDC